MTKWGRNELCHCGSGLKYKRCHLGKDEQAAGSGTPSTAPAFDPTTIDIHEMIEGLTWSSEAYRELSNELVANMQGRYEPDTVYFAVILWNRFSSETQPVYRKTGVYCAAIEFFFNGGTMAELAAKYEVSSSTLSKRYQEVFDFALSLSFGAGPA
ncbi:SEC-C domain-containing protein [Paenibacillus aurantiacus]|uniref:SEC-C domain-containing protein n=1 Tax=Paenibacillus aurantiacus TaxID=1936118 RepID=A0ABV5KQN4_9BACL